MHFVNKAACKNNVFPHCCKNNICIMTKEILCLKAYKNIRTPFLLAFTGLISLPDDFQCGKKTI